MSAFRHPKPSPETRCFFVDRLERVLIFVEIIGRQAGLLRLGQSKLEPRFGNIRFHIYPLGQRAAEKTLPVGMALRGGAAEQCVSQGQVLFDRTAVIMQEAESKFRLGLIVFGAETELFSGVPHILHRPGAEIIHIANILIGFGIALVGGAAKQLRRAREIARHTLSF